MPTLLLCLATIGFPMPRPTLCHANPHRMPTSPICVGHAIRYRGSCPCLNNPHQHYLGSKQQQAPHRRSKSTAGHPRTGWNWHKGPAPTQRTQTPKKTHPEPEDGNSKQPSPSTQLCPMNSKPWSLQPAKHCFTPKLALLQAEPSPPYLTPQSFNTCPTSSGFSFSVVFVCASHSPHVVVGAVALVTFSATTAHAACAQSGVLRARGGPVERAAAPI